MRDVQRRICRWPRYGFVLGRRARGETGQSMVELAVIVPLLLLLLIGAVELGRVGYAAIEVSNAARAGVAYGAQNVFTAVDLDAMKAAATSDAADVVGWKSVTFTTTASKYCLCSNGQTITCSGAGTSCTSPSRILVYVQVSTQASLAAMYSVPWLPKSYIIRGNAIMRVQQ
jgi:Flp pilus assembly protein TadG